MDAKDFRIGNIIEYWIDTDNLGWQICRIDIQDLKRLSEQPESFKSEHRFVVLTEEILLKCCFVKDGCWFNLHFGFYSIGISNDESGFNYVWDDGFRTIKYLHQLQNLYFALTNDELEINL